MPKINKSDIQAVVRNNKYVGAMMIGDRDAHTTFSIQPFAAVGPHTVEVPYWASQITVAFSGGGGSGGNGGTSGQNGTGGIGGAVIIERFVVDPEVRELSMYIGGGGPRNDSKEGLNGLNGANTTVTYNGVTRTAPGGLAGTGKAGGNNQTGSAKSALFYNTHVDLERMVESNVFKPGVPGVGQSIGAGGGTAGQYGAGGGGGTGGWVGQWSPGGAGGNGMAVVYMIGRTLP